MKVAFVSFGFGEYTIRLASALAETSEVALWLPEDEAAAYMDRLTPRVDFRPFHKPRMRQIHRQVPAMNRLRREIAAFEPDVIHLQQGFIWFNPVLRLLRRYPLVVTVHDPTPHLGDLLSRKTPQFMTDIAYRRATALIVHNEQVREVMAKRGFASKRSFVVPHPTLGEPYSASSEEAGADILFFGRIWPYKGLEYLIAAEPLIGAEIPEVRIVIAGTGEEMARYRAMMVNPERFEILNEFIPDDQTSELFRSASVVVLPYVDATQSGVIPMAYHYARPVVATAVGGLPSQIDDGETGFLVPPRDEGALAEAIVRLLKNPALRARLGANAKEKAETELSAAVVAAKTLAAYRAVAARKSA